MSAEIDHAILMPYDAMRICMGQSPVNATVSEVIRWMQVISGEPDRIAELESERERLIAERRGVDSLVDAQKKEIERLLNKPMPSCAHCRGEIGVILTSVWEQGETKRRIAELEKERDEAKAQATAFCEKWVQLESEVARLREERDDLLEFKREVDGDGLVPAVRVAILDETEREVERLRKDEAIVDWLEANPFMAYRGIDHESGEPETLRWSMRGRD